jgi:transcriptional regulator with XRE-family HTH domain
MTNKDMAKARAQRGRQPCFANEEAQVAALRDRAKFQPPLFAMRKPGQRRKDHGARKREAEWRAYQGTWQRPIDELECTAEAFYNLRRNALGLNREQAGRLLRVGSQSLLNWEHGRHPVPFYAFLAMLLISESQHYRLANEAWREWEFVQRFDADASLPVKQRKHVATLVNRETGAHFTPDELDRLHFTMQKLVQLESENRALRGKVEALTSENSEIRELFRVDGVTGELHDMRERLEALLGKINTAAVLPLRKTA